MSELQFIVDQLNKQPFQLRLTLVEFDEKNSFELLQLLNQVLVEIDKKHEIDLRAEPDEQRTNRFLQLLQTLRYPLPSDHELFREELTLGDRQVVYPILHWILKNLSMHQKRAYLGQYLKPVPVPSEFLMDEALQSLNEEYKNAQEEFKKCHKQIEQLRSSKSRPNELQKEISQLEEESQQLQEKVASIKRKSGNDKNFKEIFEASSALRKEQEEQAKLHDRKREQLMALQHVERRVRETESRLDDLRQSVSQDISPEQLFDRLAMQVERNREIIQQTLPIEIQKQQKNLQILEQKLQSPAKTEADIEDKEHEATSLLDANQQLRLEINQAQAKAGDDNLSIFRQHASVQAKKVIEKQDQLESLHETNDKISTEIENMEKKIHDISAAKGQRFMSREEFKQYANALRNKTSQYKKLKAEAAEITTESVVLHRTEQILKAKSTDLEGFLKGIEAEKGISGFIETQDKLEKISEQNAEMNQAKADTLEEISRIVAGMNQKLKLRKNDLAPQIKELRDVRQQFQETEQIYTEKKMQYENTIVGLETERIKLEQDCNAFQQDCLREESQFHTLHCLLAIEKGKDERLQQEMGFERGDGKLLRDIKSFQDLYRQKIAQQESLTKELRKQQKALKANAPEFEVQREQFQQLKTLLQSKLSLMQKEEESLRAPVKSGGNAGMDGGVNFVGNANVMTLDA